jgi:type I restriction enzyme, S subunit
LITAKNIRPGYVTMEPREYIADDAYTGWMKRGIPRIGDVLITTEAPLGNVATVDWEFKFALAQRVICLQFQNDISVGKFAAIALQAPAFQFTLGEHSTGTTVAGIKALRLKELEIVLPSIDEQHEIVRRVEALFAYADRLEGRYTAARAQVERLTPALLTKAFRGELVPQHPNDEPASVLLERIRAAHPEQPTAKRRRKPPARRAPRASREKAAMTKSRQDDNVQHKPYLAGLLRETGGIMSVENLFRHAELPVTDFYKQLAWEVENGHIHDDETRLEAA